MKIDWQNHLVNFVLIVFSILLAFNLERCASERREQRLVDAHLAEIVKETQFNLNSHSETIEGQRKQQVFLDSLIRLIRSGSDPAEINPVVMQAMNMSLPFTKTTAYNTFLQTGDIRYMNDFKVKSDLISLYEFYKIAEVYNELMVENYDNGFFSHIKAHLDIVGQEPQELEVYTDRSFVNSIASVRYFLVNSIDMLENDRERMQAFIDQRESAK
ncbi:hypothetical protein [Neolewinella litorea]|uniref:Uncharacterized protein n=1 Tax=Neolewinella litorea TaxID=2562452 RepID=A0A4S4NG04_9BACT|nr:hypothetical protein [Neolewinella litorea]THH37745.1 hypothetical protein E4021_13710 [Neolewinella litorea]